MGLGNELATANVIRIGVLDNDPFALDAIDQIAASLGLSVSTVKTHIGNILRETGQTNRVRLIVWSVRHSM
ncbi:MULTISPECIES: LuxR C-terminal-related transcriptional regulator [Bifidobacterium]|nr:MULTISPECIES: LuxR C-terminal-related transcriptional regulator [Bifidobacterium]